MSVHFYMKGKDVSDVGDLQTQFLAAPYLKGQIDRERAALRADEYKEVTSKLKSLMTDIQYAHSCEIIDRINELMAEAQAKGQKLRGSARESCVISLDTARTYDKPSGGFTVKGTCGDGKRNYVIYTLDGRRKQLKFDCRELHQGGVARPMFSIEGYKPFGIPVFYQRSHRKWEKQEREADEFWDDD